MQPRNQPFGPYAIVDKVRLRRAAARYAVHGWPVTPGARLRGAAFVCGRAGCPTTGCHPALEQWREAASTDPTRVAAWWRRRGHTVLLATGVTFEVLDVPALLGPWMVAAAAGAGQGPVAVTPAGRWMFWVQAGGPAQPMLRCRPDVVWHGPGSWIPAAPSRLPGGRVRWAVPPEQTGWRLPGADAVLSIFADGLVALGADAPSTGAQSTGAQSTDGPRQVPAARRAA